MTVGGHSGGGQWTRCVLFLIDFRQLSIIFNDVQLFLLSADILHRLSTLLPHYCQDAALCSTPKGVVVAVVVVVVVVVVASVAMV